MSRHKDQEWNLPATSSYDSATLATLMDIRDELKTLNKVFACHNFVSIPHKLRNIVTNTNRIPKKKRKK